MLDANAERQITTPLKSSLKKSGDSAPGTSTSRTSTPGSAEGLFPDAHQEEQDAEQLFMPDSDDETDFYKHS